MVNKSVIQEESFKETEIGKIPVDWEVSTLHEISLKVTDGSHFSPKESKTGNKIIATVKDMEYYQFSFKNCKRIADENFNLLVKNGCSPEKGDIIISKDGANCLNLIFVYNQDKKIVLLSSIAIVKLKKGFNPQFYRYYLLSPVAQKIMREGYVSGSAIPRVILKDFKKVPVPILPNIETQNKIADILSALDDKIAHNRQMNSTLEAIGQALFRRWFVDFEFPDEEGKPYRSSGGEMVETELGGVPKGWRIGTLGEFCDIIMGQSPPGTTYNEIGDGLAFYQGITDFGFRFPGRRVYCTAPTRFAEEGDVLLSVRAPVGSLNVADERCAIGRGVTALRMKGKQHGYLYYLLCATQSGWNKFEAEGTVFGSVGKSDVHGFKFILPHEYFIERFGSLVEPLDKQIAINEKQSRTLALLRDALLPKLMSGEIRVKVSESEGAQ